MYYFVCNRQNITVYSRRVGRRSHALDKDPSHESHHTLHKHNSGTSDKHPIANKLHHNHTEFTRHPLINTTSDKINIDNRKGAHSHKRKVKSSSAPSNFVTSSQKSQRRMAPLDVTTFQTSNDWGPKVKPVNAKHNRFLRHKMHHKPRKHVQSRVARLPRTEPEDDGFFSSTWRKIKNLFGGTETTTEMPITNTTESSGILITDSPKISKRTWIIAKPHTKNTRSENQKKIKRKYEKLDRHNSFRHTHNHKSNHKTPIIRKRKSFHDVKKPFVQKGGGNLVNNTKENTKNDSNTGILVSASNNIKNFVVPTTTNASVASDRNTSDDSAWNKIKNFFVPTSTNTSVASDRSTSDDSTWNKIKNFFVSTTTNASVTSDRTSDDSAWNESTALPFYSNNFSSEVNNQVRSTSESTRNKRFGIKSSDNLNLQSASENALEPVDNDINVVLVHKRLPIPNKEFEREPNDVHDIQSRQKDSPKADEKGLKLSKVIVKSVRQNIKEVIRVYDVKNNPFLENDLSKSHEEEIEDDVHFPNSFKSGNKQTDSNLLPDILLPNGKFTQQKGAAGTAHNLVKGNNSDFQYGKNEISPKNTSMRYNINKYGKEIITPEVSFRDKERTIPSRANPNVLSNLIQTENSFLTTTLRYAFKDGNGTGLIIVSSQEGVKKAKNLLTSDQKLEAVVEETNVSKEEMTKYLHAKNDEEDRNIKKKSIIKARSSPESEHIENGYPNVSNGNVTLNETTGVGLSVTSTSTQESTNEAKNLTAESYNGFTSENFTDPPLVVNTTADISSYHTEYVPTNVTIENKSVSDVFNSSTSNDSLNNTEIEVSPAAFPITSTVATKIGEDFKATLSTFSATPNNDTVRGKRDRTFSRNILTGNNRRQEVVTESLEDVKTPARDIKLKASKELKVLRNSEDNSAAEIDDGNISEEDETSSRYIYAEEDFTSTTEESTEYFTSDSNVAEEDAQSVDNDYA